MEKYSHQASTVSISSDQLNRLCPDPEPNADLGNGPVITIVIVLASSKKWFCGVGKMVNLVEELKSQSFYLIDTCGYVRQGKDCIGSSRERGRVIF